MLFFQTFVFSHNELILSCLVLTAVQMQHSLQTSSFVEEVASVVETASEKLKSLEIWQEIPELQCTICRMC